MPVLTPIGPAALGAGKLLEHVLQARSRLHRGDRIVEQHQHAIAEILDDAPAGTGEVAAERACTG